jgi:phosphatidylserine/phosphatidylglycerophosphate/cardiolipin synthase-like enzyme
LEAKGNTVEIIIPPNGAKPSVLSELANAGVKVKTISTIYMHAKMIVGSKIGFIGSENFTTTSMTYNREVGILIDSRSDMKALSDAFNEDWNDAK